MITVKYNGKLIKISDKDYNEVFVGCEGACSHCMLDGGCELQRKMEKR